MIRILKLANGEEVIGRIHVPQFDNSVIAMTKVMSLAMHPDKGLVLMKYAPYVKNEMIEFSVNTILTAPLEPVDSMVKLYESLTEESVILTPNKQIII